MKNQESMDKDERIRELEATLKNCDKVRQLFDGLELQDTIDEDGVPYQSKFLVSILVDS